MERTDLEISFEKGSGRLRKEFVLKETCQIHPNIGLDFISFDEKQPFIFKCNHCISDDDDVKQNTLIPLDQIMNPDHNIIFANFPISNRLLIKEAKGIVANSDIGKVYNDNIDDFFKEFRAVILHRIDTLQEKMIEKGREIQNFSKKMIDIYNRICPKTEFKTILADDQKSIDDKSKEIKKKCQEVLAKDEENTHEIQAALDHQKLILKAIDFDTPKKTMELILEQIDSINFILVDSLNQLGTGLKSSSNGQSQKVINDLMKYISHPLAQVSAESCAILEEQLNKISFALPQLEVPTPGKFFESRPKLTSEQIEILGEIVSNLVDCQGDLVELEKSESEDQERLKAEDLIQFVSNSMNFCSDEFLADISKVISKNEKYLNQFVVQKPSCNKEYIDGFNSIPKQKLEQLGKLALQIQLLIETHGDSYLNAKTPFAFCQSNQQLLAFSCLRQINPLFQSKEEYQTLKDSMNQLLVDFPIFELIPKIERMKSLPIKLFHTKREKSSSMQIVESEKGVTLSLNENFGQSVTEILQNDKTYLIRLDFGKPFGKSTGGYFKIGLIPNSNIDSAEVLNIGTESGLHTDTNQGASILKKGVKLSSDPVRNKVQCVEFRFCIQKQKLFIADSDYQNINQAPENLFKPEETYRFGIYFNNLTEKDWKLTITEFAEISYDSVSFE